MRGFQISNFKFEIEFQNLKTRINFPAIFTAMLFLLFVPGKASGEAVMEKIELRSPDFQNGGAIPSPYTCDGADISPPLEWFGTPAGAKSLTILVSDPDAPNGNWVHWVLYDLPASLGEIPAGVSPDERPLIGGTHGVTDFGTLGYGGPCPPSGTHRYIFKIYALDTVLGLEPGASQKYVEQAMRGHVLAAGELMAKYQRRKVGARI